jgi:hypothetical protein
MYLDRIDDVLFSRWREENRVFIAEDAVTVTS